MKIDQGVKRESAKKLLDEGEIKFLANMRDLFGPAVVQKRPSAHIERDPNEGLIHRVMSGPVAEDAALFTKGAVEGLSEDDPGVFHRMVKVDFDITDSLYRKIKTAVFGKECQHMVKKRHPGGDGGCARPVDEEVQKDIRFAGFSSNFAVPFFRHDKFGLRMTSRLQTSTVLSGSSTAY